MARILTVDDDVEIRKMIECILRRQDHEVFTCSDAFEALERVKSLSFDLILLDVNMPFMSGYNLAKRIRHNFKNKDTSLAFLTARKFKSDVLRALDCGGNDFIIKPITNTGLINRVNQLLRFSGQSVMQEEAHVEVTGPFDANQISVSQISETGLTLISNGPLGRNGSSLKVAARLFNTLGYESVKTTIYKTENLPNGKCSTKLLYKTNNHDFYKSIRSELMRIQKNGRFNDSYIFIA